MRRRSATAAVAAVAAALTMSVADPAGAVTTNCAVNASGGYVNCLSASWVGSERSKAWHVAGLPYRYQLVRFSDGAVWGWWQWNDLDYHIVSIAIAGTVTAQVDNRGTANPASYWQELT